MRWKTAPHFDFRGPPIYHRALMQSALPEWVSPHKLCDRGGSVAGRVPVSGLARLCELLHTLEGEVDARLDFGRDDARQPYVVVRVSAVLQLTCQRCMQAVSWPLERTTRLEPVDNENDAEQVEEPLLVEVRGISPPAVVEDELILALPVVARHADAERCMPRNPAQPEQDSLRDNPFAILRQLKS